jgi:hypothetical protein
MAIFSNAMLPAKEVESALKVAKKMAASKGETLQDWYYYVSPNKLPVHLFRDDKEKYLLQVGRDETTISLGRQVSDPDSDIRVEGIVFDYSKRIEIIKVIIAFFLEPDRTFVALQNIDGVERIVLSESEFPGSLT